jgi:hypothetical protein
MGSWFLSNLKAVFSGIFLKLRPAYSFRPFGRQHLKRNQSSEIYRFA